MGTEILRPQDCLTERIRFNPAMCSRRRNYGYSNNPIYSNYNNNRTNNRRPAVRHEKPDQRRQQGAHSEPSMSRRTSVSDDSKAVRRSSCDDLVMEKVTILRRESLDSNIKTGNGAGTTSSKKDGDSLVLTGTVRMGAGPEMVPSIRIVDFKSPVARKTNVYAGSAFAISPAPSSLPLPSFSKKKQISIDDSATRDIKRLLRLEL